MEISLRRSKMSDVLAVFKKRIEGVRKGIGNLNEKPPSVSTRPDYVFDYSEGRKR